MSLFFIKNNVQYYFYLKVMFITKKSDKNLKKVINTKKNDEFFLKSDKTIIQKKI